jgi:ketosteroid isomerase-like protein
MKKKPARKTTPAAANARLGKAWLKAFNANDVPKLVALYADDCAHTSPKIRVLHPETGGKLLGKAELTRWWADAIDRLPSLQYEELSVTADSKRVFLEYLRHVDGEASYPVAEVFEVAQGRIKASRVYHG